MSLRSVRLLVSVCALMGTAQTARPQGSVVTLQWFETSWQTMEDRTADVFVVGYQRVWTPPPSKAGSGASIGYDLFDRFDLGSPGSTTRYGTRAGLEAVVAEQNKAVIGTFIDLILNHNGFSTRDTPGFEASGDYPGFVVSGGPEANGDFHSVFNDCNADPLRCRISGLIDIGQEFATPSYIRHPVTPGDPQNIPAGTTYDQPSASNRQFYSDSDLPANSIGIHPFNKLDPTAGDPVAENATGLLLRHVRWLLEVIGVDGFRIDACKHTPDWFWRDFYDRHVWQRGQPTLTGAATTPLSFGESILSNAEIAAFVCKGTTGNCNTSGGVTGNRDALDFQLYYALRDMLNANGFGNWSNVVNASFDGQFDGNANDGDFGVIFAENHDAGQPLPTPNMVAYAYILTRTGAPIVYYRAEEFGTPSFPRSSRSDPLGLGDNYITNLVKIHNEYCRDTYIERWIDGDVLVYERNNACLVGLNDRRDGSPGYDQRTVNTNFAPNLRLKELTGNAADPAVDPTGVIDDVITVAANGQVTIRVPRNQNVNGVTHNRGYVVYGPFNPPGTLTLTSVASTIPADSAGVPAARRRLTPIEVIQADSFEVKLETTDADATDTGEDDLAMLRMDAGLDLNGNGSIDSLDASFVGYGYEHFLTQNNPLETNPVEVSPGVFRGVYRQVIDATQLSEGRHYLSVIAFRSRPPGTPPIFNTFRKVLLIDRVPPQMALLAPAAGSPITTSTYQIVVRSADRTAQQVHLFLDQPPGTDVVALAQGGQGLATQIDRGQFGRVFSSLTAGNHRLDAVAYEPTRSNPSVSTFNVPVVINGFDGLGDLNADGKVSNRDIFPFVQMVQAGNQFNPAADLSGDGVVNSADVPLMAAKLRGAGAPQAMIDELLKLAESLRKQKIVQPAGSPAEVSRRG